MSPAAPQVTAGGVPTAAEAAALTAAVAAVLEGEAAAAHAPEPVAYRSRWRRAAVLDAVRPMPSAADLDPPVRR